MPVTFNQAIEELRIEGWDKKFIALCEELIPKTRWERLQKFEKFSDVGSLIRVPFDYLFWEDARFEFWQKVLFFFITPKFARHSLRVQIEAIENKQTT